MIKLITISSACLALTLTACSKEQTAELVQSDANNATEQSQTLRIAAAANLSDVLPEIIAGYKMDKNLPAQAIDVTYASSGKLYAQITSGAPYDIFLSANQEFPAKLAKEKLDNAKSADEATHEPFTYTQGQLALYSVNKSLKGLNNTTLNALLMSESDSKITIANPELAPYGKSAQAYLQTQKIFDTLTEQSRIIQAENIGQAFQYAHTGNVDYGFVAQSQLTAIKATPEQFYTLAPDTYPPILQEGLVISETTAATDFSNYLRSPAGQQYFSDAGYLAID
ncbi:MULTISPECIES: molybdate ABC transporter substrate-binding protein [unclassified Psychrobacter]|uniref:molybdate ABC transporter substrate-binding protein n=1 Tax=unclassified Psychrobacter TaxID=196806 RepID=UPI000EEAFCC1|nr:MULTISPECIES: molybdate ABC transporter substrate-binding protein [unclassified Psychrobacter]MBE8609633.1 molybdate ABC transporter substrate-binding protein [Pseudomonas lundensis]HCI76283.1 molybdate ABC transporter substrate-binding protein [Psychrobacter sp.]